MVFGRLSRRVNYVTLAIEDRDRRNIKYSKEAMKDLEKSLKVIEDMYGAALQVLTTGDEESARKIRKKKEKHFVPMI